MSINTFKESFNDILDDILAAGPCPVFAVARPDGSVIENATRAEITVKGFGVLPETLTAEDFDALRAVFGTLNSQNPNDIWLKDGTDYKITNYGEFHDGTAKAFMGRYWDVVDTKGEHALSCAGLLISGPGSSGRLLHPIVRPDIEGIAALILPYQYSGGQLQARRGFQIYSYDLGTSSDQTTLFATPDVVPNYTSQPVTNGYRVALIYPPQYAQDNTWPTPEYIREAKKALQKWKKRKRQRPEVLISQLQERVDPLNQPEEDHQEDRTRDETLLRHFSPEAINLGFELYRAVLVYQEVGYLHRARYLEEASKALPSFRMKDTAWTTDAVTQLEDARLLNSRGEAIHQTDLSSIIVDDSALLGTTVEGFAKWALIQDVDHESTLGPEGHGEYHRIVNARKANVLVMFPPDLPL